MIAPGEVELAFVHPVLREAVLTELDPATRAELHAAAARGLQATGADVERIADHLVMAPVGTLPDAGALLAPVARAALGRGDNPTAVRLLRRALAEDPADDGAGRRARLRAAAHGRSGRGEAAAGPGRGGRPPTTTSAPGGWVGLAEATAGADGLRVAAADLAGGTGRRGRPRPRRPACARGPPRHHHPRSCWTRCPAPAAGSRRSPTSRATPGTSSRCWGSSPSGG